MAIVKAKIRQWGSSLGIIIPREKVLEENLKINQEITIEVKKADGLENVFGSLINWKRDSQKVKEELREGWSKW